MKRLFVVVVLPLVALVGLALGALTGLRPLGESPAK